MPFLFWMPMIVFSGLWGLVEENTRAMTQMGEPQVITQAGEPQE